MKYTTSKIWLLLLMLSHLIYMYAGQPAYSFITIGIDGAYSGNIGTTTAVEPSLYDIAVTQGEKLCANGAAAGIRAGYELQYNSFLFSIEIGATFSFNSAALQMRDTLFGLNDGAAGALHEYDNLYNEVQQTDATISYTRTWLRVPVMFGYTANGFYIKGGVVAGICLRGRQKLQYTTDAYADYIAFAEDFSSHPLVYKGSFSGENTDHYSSHPLNIYPRLEAGAQLGGGYSRRTHTSYRIGVYAEYGLMNLQTRPASILNPMHELEVGISFTALFRLNNKKEVCRCMP